jgi:hypothetical protein
MDPRYAISAGTGAGVCTAVFSITVVVSGEGAVVTFVVPGVYSSTHPAVTRTAITRKRVKYRFIVF